MHRVWTSRYGRGTLPSPALDYLTFYLRTLARLIALADRETIVIARTDPPMISTFPAVVAWLKGALNRRFSKSLKGARVLLLGVAYKKNVNDVRESPAFAIIEGWKSGEQGSIISTRSWRGSRRRASTAHSPAGARSGGRERESAATTRRSFAPITRGWTTGSW